MLAALLFDEGRALPRIRANSGAFPPQAPITLRRDLA
jgi:hypothetical protein